jgi:hypothetical protein
MFFHHVFLDAVGAEAFDFSLNVKTRFIDRIAKGFAGVSANDQIAALGHERRHMPHRPPDDDIDPFH